MMATYWGAVALKRREAWDRRNTLAPLANAIDRGKKIFIMMKKFVRWRINYSVRAGAKTATTLSIGQRAEQKVLG